MVDAENQMLRGGGPRVSREVVVEAERLVARVVAELARRQHAAPLRPDPQPEAT
jgi:hypothetical protein